jgi:hypothetical protein
MDSGFCGAADKCEPDMAIVPYEEEREQGRHDEQKSQQDSGDNGQVFHIGVPIDSMGG